MTITLDEQLFVERGHVGSRNTGASGTGRTAPRVSRRFTASLFWMGGSRLAVGEPVRLKLATQETTARITAISRVLDASTLETVEGTRDYMAQNDVAEITVETDKPVAFDLHDDVATLGRFVLVHERRVAGGGIITGTAEATALPRQTSDAARAQNLTWSDTLVSTEEQAARVGHKGAIFWLTGLSGSGKSTIASTVNRALFERGYSATVLDGDNLRHGLCADLGFSDADRKENIRRAAHVARLFAENGFVVLASFISPTRADRDAARAIAGSGEIAFTEVYVEASLEACERRDPKGLYKRARAGEIPRFTGVDSPYEPPTSPELTLSTETQTPEQASESLLGVVEQIAAP